MLGSSHTFKVHVAGQIGSNACPMKGKRPCASCFGNWGASKGPLLHTAILVFLLSATICHAQSGCYISEPLNVPPDFNFSPNVWAPGKTYTVQIQGSWLTNPPIPVGCFKETIRIYENSTYPYPLTNIDPYVTVSNIQYVDPTHTTFSAAVAAAAPTEDDAIDMEC